MPQLTFFSGAPGQIICRVNGQGNNIISVSTLIRALANRGAKS